MRISASITLILICVWSVGATRGWGADIPVEKYNREVFLDWEKIPGAKKYEVEWMKAKNCEKSDSSVESTVVSKPSWKAALPAGHYCVRVRGVGVGDRPGQWTDYQSMAIKPKPPIRILQKSKGLYEWDDVPYADEYEIVVTDRKGKFLYKTTSKAPEFEVPEKILKQQAGKGIILKVKTRAEGLTSSVFNEKPFEFMADGSPVPLNPDGTRMPASTAGGSEAGPATAPRPEPARSIASLPKPAVRELPPQAEPEPAPVDVAVERYTISGEVPLPPSADEWKSARTPEQVAELRTRTIASARVELIEEVDQQVPSDLRVKLGAVGGLLRYGSEGGNLDGFGLGYKLDIEFNRDRPWGAFLHYYYRPLTVNDFATEVSSLSFGAERHGRLDSVGKSFFDFGFGLQLLTFPFYPGGNGSRDTAIKFVTVGATVKLGFHSAVTDKVTVKGSANFGYAPVLTVIKGFGKSGSMTGGIEAGAAYRTSHETEVEAGIRMSAISMQTDVTEGTPYFVEPGAYAQFVYRISASEDRKAGAEAAFREELKRRWGIRLLAPYSIYSGTTMSSNVPELEGEKNSAIGVDANIQYWFSDEHAWSGVLHSDFNSFGNSFSLLGRYEESLFRRQDMKILVQFGPQRRNVKDLTANGVNLNVTSYELATGVGLEKFWTDHVFSEMQFNVSWPILISGDKGSYSIGTSYAWDVGLLAGYRISPRISLLGGYRFIVMRYGDASGDVDLDNGPGGGDVPFSTMDRQGHELRFGVEFGF